MQLNRRISPSPRPRRRISANKKRSRSSNFINSVSKIQKREIRSSTRSFGLISNHERFRLQMLKYLICGTSAYLMARQLGAHVSQICLQNDVKFSHVSPIFFNQQLRVASIGSLRISRTYKYLRIAASSMDPLSSISDTKFDNTLPTKEVLDIWRKADAVCFDVDSTVCVDEGIDELADFCGAGKAVAEWTSKAMSGSVPFEDALDARLKLFNPSLSQLHDFLEKRPPRISPGISDLVNKLKARKTDVYLISGGFRQMINPVAEQLGIPLKNIFANNLLFGSSGEFLGFDKDEFTSRSGGKATAVQHIRKIHGYQTLIMIGDGATDLEARMPGGADLFICYGGVQLREAVAAKSDWLIFNFEDLVTSLE